jgi:protein-disulfide isomerase
LGVVGALAFAVAVVSLMGQTTPSHATAGPPISRDRIVRFLRDRFAIPETVKVSVDPLRNSTFAGFDETNVTIDSGPNGGKKSPLYVTKDGHYLVMGELFKLGSDPKAEIVKYIRETYECTPAKQVNCMPNTAKLTAGPIVKSKYPGFQQTTVTVDDGKNKLPHDVYLTLGNNVAVIGSLYDLHSNLQEKALNTFDLHNQPTVGPANAPVTIVEYADLECPSCARLHDFMERELLPKYGNKVRVVFKEFPLPMHEWSMTAAIANQCAYQINLSAYFPFRSLIFAHQGGITAANVHDAMLQYGEEVGVDRLKLAACMDTKASLQRIEENQREAKALDVSSTPTSFINGRIVVGAPPPEQYFALIDEALRGGK